MDGSAPSLASAADLAAHSEALFRRHDRWLRAALRKRYGQDLADEVTSEAFVRAAPYAAAGTLRNPKAFLLRVAQNLVIDILRRSRADTDTVLPGNEKALPPIQASQDETLTLKQILLALPPELRDVFFLSHIEGLTYEEISATLGIPVTTVHHRMRKAIAKTVAAMRA